MSEPKCEVWRIIEERLFDDYLVGRSERRLLLANDREGPMYALPPAQAYAKLLSFQKMYTDGNYGRGTIYRFELREAS